MIKARLLWCIASWCLGWALIAQPTASALHFSAVTSTDTLLMHHPLIVTFCLENAEGEDFAAPIFDGFQVTQGPAHQSSIRIVNGQMAQRICYQYRLLPEAPGRYAIAPATLRVGEKWLASDSMVVVVLPNPAGLCPAPSDKSTDRWPGNLPPPLICPPQVPRDSLPPTKGAPKRRKIVST